MKKWIKSKLTSFLEIDYIENKLTEENRRLNDKMKNLERLNQKLSEENNFIMKQFNISADIRHYENHSWAVISIQGKPEYVKFVHLSTKDMHSLYSFLKQFERCNRTIDTPMQFMKW